MGSRHYLLYLVCGGGGDSGHSVYLFDRDDRGVGQCCFQRGGLVPAGCHHHIFYRAAGVEIGSADGGVRLAGCCSYIWDWQIDWWKFGGLMQCKD